MKPVLFVTGHAPPDRVGAFARLHAREGVVFALFGGRTAHGPPIRAEADGQDDQDRERGFPVLTVAQHEVWELASSGSYRAVVCGTGGRLALPAAWSGARRARVPFLLWSSLWSHPASLAHALSYLVMRRIYRSADAIVTYGPHVSAYVRARGARNVYVAPQAVDNAFWSAGARSDAARGPFDAARGPSDPARGPSDAADAPFTALFVGRAVREKGLRVLVDAWRASRLGTSADRLLLVGVEAEQPEVAGTAGITALGVRPALELRNLYGSADVLIMPSIPTRTFHEPWGLVVNEAFNQGVPVIASDAVGAAAGGLVRHDRNGIIVRAGDAGALAAALVRLRADPELRRRLGSAAARDVAAFTYDTWAAGFSAALASVSATREPC